MRGFRVFAGHPTEGWVGGELQSGLVRSARRSPANGLRLLFRWVEIPLGTNVFQRDEPGKAIAIWPAVGRMGMGIGLGPAVGGYLVDRWDWAVAFWIHIPIIVLALIGQAIVKESRDSRDIGVDVRGCDHGNPRYLDPRVRDHSGR